MSNNAPNYQELAFEPEMTWRDLETWVKKEWSNNMSPDVQLTMYSHEFFLLNNIIFFKTGTILTSSREFIASGVSYKRMQTIIKSLFEG